MLSFREVLIKNICKKGSSQALHAVDGVWKKTTTQREEVEGDNKQLGLPQTQQLIGTIVNDECVGKEKESEEVYKDIELQNIEVQRVFSSFKLMRAFANLKNACQQEKYEKEIKRIYENNSSNEQLYRDKKEMQANSETMEDQLLMMKKTMAIMEYQNEILRRDVQRSRKDRLKTMKASKLKDKRIHILEDKIENILLEKTQSATNPVRCNDQASRIQSCNRIIKQNNPSQMTNYFNGSQLKNSQTSDANKNNPNLTSPNQLADTYSQIDSSLFLQQNIQFVSSIKRPSITTTNIMQNHKSMTNQIGYVSEANSFTQHSFLQRRPTTTALLTSKQGQLKTPLQKSIDPNSQGLSTPLLQSTQVSNLNKQSTLQLSNLLNKHVSSTHITPASTSFCKSTSHPKALSIIYKVKKNQPLNQAN